MKTPTILLTGLTLALFSQGCASHKQHGHGHGAAAHESSWSAVKQLVAVIHPTAGNKCAGVIRFTDVGGNKVEVVAELTGLNPKQKHAMHIHEAGDCSKADGTSAGGHYNPEGHAHGLPEAGQRHAGDLGNVQADANGQGVHRLIVDNVTIAGLKNPIIGRSVIVHAQADDGGQPTGNAGARIGCGVIGTVLPAAK